jgi:L-rhamnose mutarotase
METTGIRQYAIELFVDERWQELYRTSEKADAEGVWQRVLETQPRSEARLVELDVLRSFAGDTDAKSSL